MTDPLLRLTLGAAWRELVYTASCSNCRHWTRVDLKAIAERLGDEFPLRDLRARLKCAKCGGKQIIISIVEKNSTAAASYLQRWPFAYDLSCVEVRKVFASIGPVAPD